MSIAAIGGASLQAVLQPSSVPAKKPESAEVPGAPDHDGDADDGGSASAAGASRGSVNVLA
jgi:hypothetical protein